MNVNKDTINQLLSSMKDYNLTANAFSEDVAKALMAVGLAILGVVWYIEFADLNRRFSTGADDVKTTFWLRLAITYLVGMALIMLGPQIIDALVWLNSAIGHLINNVKLDGGHGSANIPNITKKAHGWEKFVIGWLQTCGNIFIWLDQIIINLLIFLRFLTLYIMKAAIPVMVALYASEEFKSISMGFFKQVAALVIQSFLLVLIVKLYPVLINNDIFSVVANGDVAQNIAAMFEVIVKGVVIMVTLIGSQVMARRWMGV
ncbi:hypothetical protein WOSG25_090260 [Weissella oryzae SG25]|uniref:TrbL/VirB6 plasmid conjugal transfer protein n=1 Tax=Weissella oryzae (strain DSM 25784 / JCM 18191 / LMG 30913 / SG25) TaxID=1329250 RepID=A0A069CV56_WEIOS|nr:hypothetical protein [Weissella oryzae]GAK31329.1 hypothetical protein WOSG25_090260 [Weissella oryzae SG25]